MEISDVPVIDCPDYIAHELMKKGLHVQLAELLGRQGLDVGSR